MPELSASTLTPFQQACVDQFLLAPADQAAAYIKACQAVGRTIGKVPKRNAHQAYQHPAVRAEIARRQAERGFRLQFSQDEVLRELRDQLSVTLPDVLEWDEDSAALKPSSKLTREQRKAIKKIKVRRHSYKDHDDQEHVEMTMEVELHDRMRITEAVMKHLGMLKGEGGEGTTINNYVLVLPEAPAKTVDEWQKRYSPRLK